MATHFARTQHRPAGTRGERAADRAVTERARYFRTNTATVRPGTVKVPDAAS